MTAKATRHDWTINSSKDKSIQTLQNEIIVGEEMDQLPVEKYHVHVFVQVTVGDCDKFVNSAMYLPAKVAPNIR